MAAAAVAAPWGSFSVRTDIGSRAVHNAFNIPSIIRTVRSVNIRRTHFRAFQINLARQLLAVSRDQAAEWIPSIRQLRIRASSPWRINRDQSRCGWRH